MEDSVFTKIINGEIPGEIVYQDDMAVALLTIDPLTPGHLLVIPRQQIDHLWDVEDPLYGHLMEVTKKMAYALRRAYNYKRIGSIVEGFGVPHAHIHVFGLNELLEQITIRHAASKQTTTQEELATEASKIRAAL